MQFHQPAEVIADDHRVIANVKIVFFEEDNETLYTLIPRSLNGSPVPFANTEFYNLVCTSYESLHFFKVVFEELTQLDEKPVYKFKVLNYKGVDNLRKEERKSVEYQAVVSDFIQVGFVTILDISYSGLRIETDYKIESEFIEIFFDEENVPRRAMGKITWSEYDPDKQIHFYGVELRYR